MSRATLLTLTLTLPWLTGCSSEENEPPPVEETGGAGGLAGAGGQAGSSAGTGGVAGSAGASGAAGSAAGLGGAAGAAAGASGAASGASGLGGATSGAGGVTSGGSSGTGGSAGSAGCQSFVMPGDCTIPENAVLPAELRCTGLYGNWEARELACGVRRFEPAYPLWSDGAGKDRYVSLPEGATIDVSDPDAFLFPVGTSFWKGFRLQTGALAETRLLQKSDAGWIYTSYVWTEDQTNAVQNNDGVPNLYASGHTVPSRTQCKECHGGRADYVLGWDAFLLGPGATGVTREELLALGLIDWTGRAEGAPNPLELAVPGDDVERAALGYLHANCGVSCHNDTSLARARESGLFLNLATGSVENVQTSHAFATANGRTPSPNAPILDLPVPESGPFVDLRPLDPERSLLLARMQVRGGDAQMPLIATNRIDDSGVASVKAWIEHMTVERGYPTPAP